MEEYTPVIPPRVRTWAYVVGLIAGAAGPILAAFGLAEGWIALAAGLAGVASAIALGYRPSPLVGPSYQEMLVQANALIDEWPSAEEPGKPDGC